MINKIEANRGGSNIIFIIISLVLIAGLAGGLYYVRYHGEQARRDKAIAELDQGEAENNQSEAAQDDDEKVGDTNSDAVSGQVEYSDELPVTGPSGFVFKAVEVVTLTTIITGYASSRRKLELHL